MAKIYNAEELRERAESLEARNLNGFRLVFVSLDAADPPQHAFLDVEFFNPNGVSTGATNILDDITGGTPIEQVFEISGGSRIVAGDEPGQVQVEDVAAGADDRTLRLRVAPVGDYSTYSLQVTYSNPPAGPSMDPVFSSIGFKFRPGCFNLNCAPEWAPGTPLPQEPAFDYLARDFDSFKHLLINAMMQRVPGWAPSSEADLDQVLIDLLAADGDELCDFQDRVMNEAYFGRARKRVSLARHARLMDYHIHQGNQASSWLALQVNQDLLLPGGLNPPGFAAWTGQNWDDDGAVIFMAGESVQLHEAVNALSLHSWGDTVSALEAGSTEADLVAGGGTLTEAEDLRDLFRSGAVPRLLIEEKLNPETGTVNGRDPQARQLLRLLEGDAAGEAVFDPLAGAAGEWLVRVFWRQEDRLTRRFCFVTRCEGQPITRDVSLFHGNLVEAFQGRPHQTTLRPPGSELGPTDASQLLHSSETHYQPTRWGVLGRLPNAPLAYRNTPPGGELPVHSTLDVEVDGVSWQEQSDLIESRDDTHFIVETDEEGLSAIRFGNGVNGLALPSDATVRACYQVGRGSGGNVGLDSLTGFDNSAAGFPEILEVWNPFDVTDGRDPELPEVMLRRVPEAYRSRQLRAVTLEDYVKRARELPQVADAYASYGWTGSWRTVRVSIDPLGVTTLSDQLRQEIAGHLNAVRLIGEDIEVRPARFAPLDIQLKICAHPDYWPEDLAAILEQEFSDDYTPDGRSGFFHPDDWTFGQPLYASQILGRALEVEGVDRVVSLSMRRWNAAFGPTSGVVVINPEDLPSAQVEKIEVQAFEIVQVANDPDHLETGRMVFQVLGGRR